MADGRAVAMKTPPNEESSFPAQTYRVQQLRVEACPLAWELTEKSLPNPNRGFGYKPRVAVV